MDNESLIAALRVVGGGEMPTWPDGEDPCRLRYEGDMGWSVVYGPHNELTEDNGGERWYHVHFLCTWEAHALAEKLLGEWLVQCGMDVCPDGVGFTVYDFGDDRMVLPEGFPTRLDALVAAVLAQEAKDNE